MPKDTYRSGGKVHQMRKPKRGRKPKRITTENEPGGPQTPGAKKRRAEERKAKENKT